ncbi:MAG: tetratricopeptide repeat protein, partial [Alphaproteobacteria bacterium]
RYLKGLLLQKTGNFDDAAKVWKPLLTSHDRYHAVQAELALVNNLFSRGEILASEAIDRVENIRFSWRGDSLEILILHRLGNLYIADQKYAAGLSILREAATLSNKPDEQDRITMDMADTFSRLFVDKDADQLSPVRALAIFNEFRELLPVGEAGNIALKNLAERLVRVDLLKQAGTLLDDLLHFRVKDKEAAEVGTRLAVVRLLDHEPKQALKALDESENDFITEDLAQERLLIRARALSDLGNVNQALELLQQTESIAAKRLEVDINWRAGRWKAVAAILEDIIDFELRNPIRGSREDMEQQQARVIDFVLKRGIALSLLERTDELKELEEDYGALMEGSPYAAAFKVVVRPPQPGTLADIQTLQERMAEIDLFHNFLKNYKIGQDNIAMAENLEEGEGE